MNSLRIIGIVLIVTGAALLAYGGFTTTNKEDLINLGPLKVQTEVKERHSVPPFISWGLLGCGLVILVVGLKTK